MTTMGTAFPASAAAGAKQCWEESSMNRPFHPLLTFVNLQIENSSIERLLSSEIFSSSFRDNGSVHGVSFPLNFPNTRSELNLLSVLSLLNFASGYRVPLHQATGRDAWDSIRAFALSLFITSSVGGEGDLLSAAGMQTIGEAKVAELMGVNIHVERPHETLPGVTLAELGGPLYELVQLTTAALNETGQVLVDGGYIDLGSFVLEALRESEKAQLKHNGSGADAEVLLERVSNWYQN
jgi:hypothetical protein